MKTPINALLAVIAFFVLSVCAAPKPEEGDFECPAWGPLSPHNTVMFGNCDSGEKYTCMATDLTGCQAGDPSNIQELVVRDPSTAAPLGGSASVSTADFVCPSTGIMSCAVIFTEQGASNADKYGIIIVSASGE